MNVHVVAKANIARHATFTVPSASLPSQLAAGYVRARPLVFSLTSNNLSYARGGTLLHWWDAYPVPNQAPAAYADRSEWGVVPCWGFAELVDSNIASLPVGTVLWGFWPTWDGPVDLPLEPAAVKGAWTETSRHRQELMTIYNHYVQRDQFTHSSTSDLGEDDVKQMQWESLFRPTWQTGFLLSNFTFAPRFTDIQPVHPLSEQQRWTEDDADLYSAVVINLSASSKTGRSFTYHILRREETIPSPSDQKSAVGPLGLVQITGQPGLVSETPSILNSSIPTKSVTYSEAAATESLDWIASLNPSRIVIVDHGAPQGNLGNLLAAFKSHGALSSLNVAVLAVGTEMKAHSPEEMQNAMKIAQQEGKILVNTSGIRDVVEKRLRPEKYEELVQAEWKHWLGLSKQLNPDIEIVASQRIDGADGVEGGWEKLCQGKVSPQKGLVYRFFKR